MSEGEEGHGLTPGWNLVFLFELHILQLFWEWSMELLFFLSSFFLKKITPYSFADVTLNFFRVLGW